MCLCWWLWHHPRRNEKCLCTNHSHWPFQQINGDKDFIYKWINLYCTVLQSMRWENICVWTTILRERYETLIFVIGRNIMMMMTTIIKWLVWKDYQSLRFSYFRLSCQWVIQCKVSRKHLLCWNCLKINK